MTVRITDLTNAPLTLPGPINDTMGPRETKTYEEIIGPHILNDYRFIRAEERGNILIEDLDEAAGAGGGAGGSLGGVTIQDMNLYVSPTGSDSTGEGTNSNPYATLGRAMDDVPFTINHTVHIRIAPGTYVETLQNMTRSYGTNGFLAVEGGGGSINVHAGPFTATAWGGAPAGVSAYSYITCAGAGWVDGEFWGKWVRVTAGTATGMMWPIHHNTSDTLSFHWVNDVAVGTVTEIEIVDGPDVVLDVERGLTIAATETAVSGGTAAGDFVNCSRFAIAGIHFRTSSLGIFPFVIDNVYGWFRFVTFQTTQAPTVSRFSTPMMITDATLNYYPPARTDTFDNVLFNLADFGGLRCVRGVSAYTGTQLINGVAIRSSTVAYVDDMYTTYMYRFVEVLFSALAVATSINTGVYFFRVLLDQSLWGRVAESVEIDNGSLSVFITHVERSNADAVRINGTISQLTYLTSNAANVTLYGLRVGTL